MSKRKKAKKKAKSTGSEEYEPPQQSPERRFPTNAVVDKNASFLDQHADYIIDQMAKRKPHDKNSGPAYIAKQLCTKAGLHEGAVHGRQISNWYDYRVRTGQIIPSKKISVSSKNNNIRASRSDCMPCILVFYHLLLGKNDLDEIAISDGEPYLEDDAEDYDEVDTGYSEYEVASKFIRVFTQEEDNYFCIFLELGVEDRIVQLTITNENSEIELSYKVPAPADALILAAGLHATKADVEETWEIFYFRPTKLLTGECEQIPYPATVPTWMIFKYKLVEQKPNAPITANLHFTQKK